MDSPESKKSRLVATLTVAALTSAIGLMLLAPDGLLGDGLLHSSYDALHFFGGTKKLGDPPVVLVYLDLASHLQQHQDPARPWPRELHARLLRRLSAAGARGAVFDVIFGTAGPDAQADEALGAAMRENGHVIFAAEHNLKSSHRTSEGQPWTRSITQSAPYEPFVKAAAGWGFASLWIDDDFMVRRHVASFGEGRPASLSWAAARSLGLPLDQAAAVADRGALWVRYYGPALTLPHVSYSEALEAAAVPDIVFRDKIVFIGARPMEGLMNEGRDEFRSPFHSWSNKEYFMPGVEVHATEMLNLIRGDWLRRLPAGAEAALLLFCAALFGGGLVWLRPVPATGVAVAGAVSVVLLANYGFSRGVWFPWMIISAAQIPAALGGSILFSSLEWLQARRRLEAARRVADAKIREQAALIDKAHDAILVQDLNGRMLYANPSAERLYGWDLQKLQEASAAAELFLLDATAAAAARTAALAQGEWNGELRLQDRAGQLVTVASRWTLIRDENNQPKALLLINSDITEKKQLESQFLRAQRMNTIGSLAGGMAHDLNNALAPILMGVQLLRRKTSDDESRHLLDLVESSTHRGADMVRQVVLFARGRGGEFEPLDAAPLLQEIEKMIRETFPKNIGVESFVPGDLWAVRSNPTQLHQILLNLCVNARDAMPEGGRLSFAADNIELTSTEAAAIPEGRPGQFVSLLVSDTGAGMTPEVRARIFEAFFTTKTEGRGTGMGLATVMRIVKSHGGFLRVESEPGQGTTFEIFLPRATETAAPHAIAPVGSLPRGQGELILVADDERAIRDLLADALVEQGYRVLTAANGEEAVELFRTHSAEVRLLVTDSAMPVMDGPGTIRQLRQLCSELPIILASGEGPGENDGDDGHLVRVTKPFSVEEILSAVHHLLSCTSQKRVS